LISASGVDAAKLPHSLYQRKAGLLALIEPVDGFANLCGTEVKPVHHEPGRSNFLLADPPIRLGEVTHAPEQGANVVIGQAAGTGAQVVKRMPFCGKSAIKLSAGEITGCNRQDLQHRGNEQYAQQSTKEGPDYPAPVQYLSCRRRRTSIPAS
jgi:hypothetical protein